MKTRTPSILALALAVVSSSFTSCASFTRGTTDTLNVRSNPSDAEVRIVRTDKPLSKAELADNLDKQKHQTATGSSALASRTPAAFDLKRKGKYQVTVSKAGYEPQIAHITHKMSKKGAAGAAGNLLIGGVIGLGVDAATGATQDLTPNPVVVNLKEH